MSLFNTIVRDRMGLIDVAKLAPTKVKDVYSYPGLFYQEIFYNDYHFFELPPVEIIDRDMVLEQCYKSVKKNQKYINSKDWLTFFELQGKKIAAHYYIKYFDKIPDNQKHDCFIAVYTMMEYGFEIFKDKYSEILSYSKYSQTRNENQLALALKYPENRITMYHGDNLSYPVYDYYSWTLNYKTAKFFAKRAGGHSQIWKKEIEINQVINYLTDRDEEEILFDLIDKDYEVIDEFFDTSREFGK